MTHPNTPVSAVMTPHPITVGPNDTIAQAMAILQEHPFRHLPVTDGDRLVGILSDRDLLLTGTDAEATRAPVRDVMHTEVHTATPTTTLGEAAETLHRERIGALPIMVGEPVQGIVTETDLLIAFRDWCRTSREETWARARVRDHMTSDPITIAYEAPLSEAMRLCRESDIRHLPVMRDDHLYGILSDRDIRRGMASLRIDQSRHEAAGEGEATERFVSEIMTKGVMVISPDSALTAAVFTMATNKIGALPVLDGADLVGVISQTDILACYARAMREPD